MAVANVPPDVVIIEEERQKEAEEEEVFGQTASRYDEGDESSSNAPQNAIDPQTGAINWDCPCLKGALEPPCGNLFKVAFSCYVASNTEPKGEDCLAAFKALTECFRAHPDKYKPDSAADDDEEEVEIEEQISLQSISVEKEAQNSGARQFPID